MEPSLEAVLLSDAVGHSRASEVAEDGIHARLRADPYRIFEPKIAAHHGRLIRTTGDGPTGASVAVQRPMREATMRMMRRHLPVLAKALSFLALCAAFMTLGDAARADITVDQVQDVVDLSGVTVVAKQAELGNDPERLFAYVRDGIRDDLYRGVLRGAVGTLLAQAGNPADKSVLLLELLKQAGHQARFAHGTLEPAKAQLLLAAALNARPPAGAAAGSVDPNVRAKIDSIRQESVAQYQAVAKTLVEGKIAIPKIPPTAMQDLVESLRDHYWIQYKKGDNWVDLDPSFPDSGPGEAQAPVAETLDALPPELFHRIVVRVMLEELRDGQLQRKSLLTYESPAPSMSDQSLLLLHEPASWSEPTAESDLAKAFGGVATAITNVLGALGGGSSGSEAREDKARPVLVLGSRYVAGDPFDMTHPENESAGHAPADQATAEWIEVAFHAPDGSVTTAERTIFDRIGYAARRQGRTAVAAWPLGLAQPLAGIYCLSFSTGPLLAPGLVPDHDDPPKSTAVPSDAQHEIMQIGSLLRGINGAIWLLSDRLTFPVSMDGAQALYVVTSPRLVISAYRSSGNSATLSLDLRHSQYRAVATSGEALEQSYKLQMFRGVLDGVLESEIVGSLFSGESADVGPGAYSTSEVFQLAQQAGTKPILLQGSSIEERPSLTQDALSRIDSDLADGNVIVVPQKSVAIRGADHTAWWRINRASGETVGVTEDGLHQAATEYVIVRRSDGSVYAIRVMGSGGQPGFFIRNVGALRAFLRSAEAIGWGVQFPDMQ